MMMALNYLKVRLACKKGQGMVEYGLILGGVAVAVVAVVAIFGPALSTFFNNLVTYITGHGPVPTTTAPTGS